jgi:hypothetical protein
MLHANVDLVYQRSMKDLEKKVMMTLNQTNRHRFRLYFYGSIAAVVFIAVVFGEKIRKAVSDQTVVIAKETLQNEALKVQTQELVLAVVQTVLNDKDITTHAASFLKEASYVPETQQALLELTLHVLRHPKCLDELTKLSKNLISELSADEVMRCSSLSLVL